jgi:hypothetical protein
METTWRYEIRGSQLYDLAEDRTVSLTEAGEILNAHQRLLITSGVWAAKAGLAQGKLDRIVSDHNKSLSPSTEQELLEDLIDEMPACDKDEARDYCLTHHTKNCGVEALIARARAFLSKLTPKTEEVEKP